MIKNIGKFKQWTGEKMGKAPKTRMDEDFNTLQAETEARKVAIDVVLETSQAYLKALNKRVESGDKQKNLAIETFGMSLSAQSNTTRDGSYYREALSHMGDAHQKIGAAQNELISRFGNTYLDSLERAHTQMKEYQVLNKKLQSRRLDYDAKLAKVQKAKKEKPEWEEEMQAAKGKYDDTRECLLGIMTHINESQDEQLLALKAYYDAQLTFARKTVEILEGIPESAFTVSPNSSPRTSPMTRNLCRQTSFDTIEEPTNSDDYPSIHSAAAGRAALERAPSSAELRLNVAAHSNHGSDLSRSMPQLSQGAHVRKNSFVAAKSNGHAALPPQLPPPALPTRGRPQKQVRALYSFEATAAEELSIQKGDVIQIIEEIDEGWWEGELMDANGRRQAGMFPSNYCEVISADANGHTNAYKQDSPKSSLSDSGRYQDEDEAAYYQREAEISSPVEQEPEPEPVATPTNRRAPPPPFRHSHVPSLSNGAAGSIMTNQHSPPSTTLARSSTHTPSRSISTTMGSPVNGKPGGIGSRVAPPPPPTRRATTLITDMSRNPPPPTAAAAPSTPTAPRTGYIPKDYFASQSNEAAAVGPCRECNCTEFTANVFKRGSCNNCFHIH